MDLTEPEAKDAIMALGSSVTPRVQTEVGAT